MDKVKRYRKIIKDIIEAHDAIPSPSPGETQLIFDEVRDHYQWLYLGWHSEFTREYGAIIHMDIINEKIYIQRDGTEYGVANELLDHGVPKTDIVLAFHAPYKRPYTDFAVA